MVFRGIQSTRRGLLVALLVGCALSVPAASVVGQHPEGAQGTSSRRARDEVIAAIPFREMVPEAAQRVANVIQKASLYRQLPVTAIKSDPDMYLYLVRYPEVVISTWQLMGVTQMTANRTGPFQLHAGDGVGTVTDVELVYGRPDLNIYYARGEYEGPMFFRKVAGECVLVLQSDYRYDHQGSVVVNSRLDIFLKIDNLAASIIAKTVHPLVGSTADHNFVESLKFFQKLSETTQRNGPGVQRMANRLPGLHRDVRHRFVEVAGVVYQREQERLSRFSSAAAAPEVPSRQVNPASYRAQ